MDHPQTLEHLTAILSVWVGAEPRLEVKVALAAHLLDDLAALERLGDAESPAAIDRRDTETTSLSAAYATTKPALAASLRAVADEPGADAATLLAIAHQQERHGVELLPHLLPDEAPDEDPHARDPFIVEVPADGPQRELHDAIARLEDAAIARDADSIRSALDDVERLDARLTASGTPWGLPEPRTGPTTVS